MCIGANAQNPERALMFLDELSTNEEVYDLVIYGVEGLTYQVQDGVYGLPDGVTMEDRDLLYMEWAGQWGFYRNYFYKVTEARPVIVDEKMEEYNKRPEFFTSKFGAFFPDPEPTKNELAQRNAIYEEFGRPLIMGLSSDPDGDLAKYIEKQQAAGSAAITAELNRQIKEHFGLN